jgi:nitrite reductase (NADH) small subunit
MENAATTPTNGRTPQRFRVCALDDIADNSGVLADIGDREIGVFKYKGKLLAYENRCIHMGGPICTGEILGATRVDLSPGGEVTRVRLDEDEMRIVCPWHGWEYDLETGQVAHDRKIRLRRYEITVEDGVVYVDA